MASFELDFALHQGSFVVEIAERCEARALALFGPSGSGKTSIIEAIAGLRVPSRGTIAIGGRVLDSRELHVHVLARDRRVGYVPQDVLLFPHLDVTRNVLYGTRDGGTPPPAGTDQPVDHVTVRPYNLDTLVELLDLAALMTRKVTSLSGGERQRVALARALMSSPNVLLLDEPMAAVDLPRRRRILDALLRIRDELRLPLVYVAHSPEEVGLIADRVLVLDAGRVVASGPPQEVLP